MYRIELKFDGEWHWFGASVNLTFPTLEEAERRLEKVKRNYSNESRIV